MQRPDKDIIRRILTQAKKATLPRPDSFKNTKKNVEVALSDLTGTNGAIWIKIDGVIKGNILLELLQWVNKIPLYKCFRHDGTLYDKLLTRGWEPNPRNIHCLIYDGVYARFV